VIVSSCTSLASNEQVLSNDIALAIGQVKPSPLGIHVAYMWSKPSIRHHLVETEDAMDAVQSAKYSQTTICP
jgi:hypothetical protein